MMELADMRDLGRVTSVKVFITRANLKIKYAGMVELVDSEDLGSSAKWRVGSSPTTRTTSSRTSYRSRRLFILKSHRSFTTSLLLSESNPLRWASIRFLVRT